LSPEKKSDVQMPKRQKKEKVVQVATKRQTRKSEAQAAEATVMLPISKKTENVRETRSKRYSEPVAAKPAKEFKSPPKKAVKRNSIAAKPPVTALDVDERRVTRSMKN
jgi:hypothetical protein